MRKISAIEVQKLIDFTRQHYVEYYDLQLELADHLACGIEEQWETNETITFEEALQNEFKKFGIFGFSEIVDKRRFALQKKYNNLIWKVMKNHLFNFQYFILIASGILLFNLIAFKYSKIAILTTIVLFFGLFIYRYIRLQKKYRQKLSVKNRKLILQELIFKNLYIISFAFSLFNLSLQALIHLNNNQIILNIVFSIIFSFIFLLFYVTCYFLPNKEEEILSEFYPEYQLIK